MKNRPLHVTAETNHTESDHIRDYCSQFDIPMGQLLTKLILWAMKNAPVEEREIEVIREEKTLVLGDDWIPYTANGNRALRGTKPGTKYKKRK